MSFPFYFDDASHVRAGIEGLREAGIEAIRSADVGMEGSADVEHLALASTRRWVLVSRNVGDFARLHSVTVAMGRQHAGIVLIHQRLRLGVGEELRRLLAIERARSLDQMRDTIEYLSRWQSD